MPDRKLIVVIMILLLMGLPLLGQDAPPASLQSAIDAANASNPELGYPNNWTWQQMSPTSNSALGCTIATGYDMGMSVTPYRFTLEFASGTYIVYASSDGSVVQLCDDKFADIAQPPTATPDPEATEELTPDPSACMLTTAGAYSNIRSSPSVDAVLVDVIYENSSYPVIGRNADWTWYLIDKGWIFNTVAVVSGDCSGLLLRNDLVLASEDGTAVPNNYACPADYAGYMPPRLQRSDDFASVDVGGVPNRLRATPSTTATQLGEIQPGQTFELLDGPACNEGYIWWYVRYNGIDGWTVENNAATQTYYLVSSAPPVDESATIGEQVGKVIAFSPDGTVLAVSDPTDEGKTVYFYDVSGQALAGPGATLTHESPVNDTVFHPDLTNVVAISTTHAVTFWDLETQAVTRVLRDASVLIDDYDMVFSPDWATMAVTSCIESNETECTKGEIRLWDVETGTLSRSIPVESAKVPFKMAYSPDGSLLIATDGIFVGFYNPTTGAEIGRIIQAMASSQTGGGTNIMDIWDVQFSPNGQRVLLAGCMSVAVDGVCSQGAIEVWDVESGTAIQIVRADAVVTSVAFGPNGLHVLGAVGAEVNMWEVSSAFQVETWGGYHTSAIITIALNGDGTVMATVDETGTLQVRTIEIPTTTSVG